MVPRVIDADAAHRAELIARYARQRAIAANRP
jgi:hypothetical protein